MCDLKLVLIIFIMFNITNNVAQDPLLNTPGCRIPNYDIEYLTFRQKLSCGKRYVFINKIGTNEIIFTVFKSFDSCAYSFIERSSVTNLQDRQYSFSPFTQFKNKTIAVLLQEFIHVICKINGDVDYVDSYSFVKPIDEKSKYNNGPTEHTKAPKYNVLMLGLDTMPRKRAYYSIEATMDYLNENNWLDFQAFNKVGDNTIPNLMALLLGNQLFYKRAECQQDMSACNHKIVWHQFQERGYVTAYGEESAYLGNTFQYDSRGFSVPPTDHYMRPFFLATEQEYGCLVCSGRDFSALNVLEYILDFVTTYPSKKYFGFFYITSLSHSINQSPAFFDNTLEKFFRTLSDLGVYKNTFVIFFSDHGIRYGPVRYVFESYYDERLPMLFMSVPDDFKRSQEYSNLVVNQHRLISPYDLHLTLWDILQISTEEILTPTADDCPNCTSLLEPIPEERTCADAGISDRWCACSVSENEINLEDYGAVYSLVKAMDHMRNFTASIPTHPCTRCAEFSIKKLLRIHYLVDHRGRKNFLLAFVATPNNVVFEVTVRRSIDFVKNEYKYDVVRVQLISQYHLSGWCVKKPDPDKLFCVCHKIKFCSELR